MNMTTCTYMYLWGGGTKARAHVRVHASPPPLMTQRVARTPPRAIFGQQTSLGLGPITYGSEVCCPNH